MAHIILPPGWSIPRHEMTPEELFVNRREFIKKAGLATIGLNAALMACRNDATQAQAVSDPDAMIPEPAPGLYPAHRNPRFKLEADRAVTEESVAATYNNFYEFANGSSHDNYVGAVHEVAEGYPFRPWEVELSGLCDNPVTLTIDEIEQLAPLEERLYRHRCVETWAMAVPWVGFSLSKLLDVARPKQEAKFIRVTSFVDKKLPGIKEASWYPWPYYEGLRMDEAMNELAMACTGIYGHALPPQHGAPIRFVIPWKYGYKSIKSIRKIEFVAEQPGTFWSELAPSEYPFESNVNPNVPHPRWSQAEEWMLGGSRFSKRDTKIYNGYGEYVAQLYA